MELFQGKVTLSGNLDYFRHRDAYFVFHNLFGYTLEMSRDLIDFLEFFRGSQVDSEAVLERFKGTFEAEQLEQFCQVFLGQGCLVPEGKNEEAVARRMVPFYARWSVFHQPEEGPVRLYVPHPERGQVDVIVLRGWDEALWRLIDQERTIDEMIDALRPHPESPRVGLEEAVLATILKLTHCDAQLLKLSPRPMGSYKGGQQSAAFPPYLRSNMPYTRVTAEIRGERDVHVGLEVEQGAQLSREQRERDSIETTLAHLFREPHPALSGRSYGGALAHLYATATDDGPALLSAGARVLEVGASRADLAVGFLTELRDHHPELAASLTFAMLIREDDRASIEADLAAAGVSATILVGDPTLVEAEGLGESWELILSNEFVANLDAVLMRKLTIGDDEEDEEEEEAEPAEGGEGGEPAATEPEPSKRNGKGGHAAARELYMGAGDSVNMVFKYNLKFHDANAEFLLNTGALRFLDRASRRLSATGVLAVIEFGDLFAYPESTGPGGTQTSIRFRTLMEVARALGFEARFEWLLARLEFSNSMQMLGTTRRQFLALRQLCAEHGIELKNIAYSRRMLEELWQGHLALNEVHQLEFYSLNDRVMGVVPSTLKILEVFRPAEAGATEAEG